jgi:hypothetical protein
MTLGTYKIEITQESDGRFVQRISIDLPAPVKVFSSPIPDGALDSYANARAELLDQFEEATGIKLAPVGAAVRVVTSGRNDR